MKYVLIILIIIFVLFMAWFNFGPKNNLILASEFRGTVFMNGKIVEGARVSQELIPTKFDSFKQEVITDKDGKFVLPSVATTSLFTGTSLDMSYSAVKQQIDIYVDGKTYLAWFYTKIDYELGSEQNAAGINKESKSPIELVCDLPSDPDHGSDHDYYYGICTIK